MQRKMNSQGRVILDLRGLAIHAFYASDKENFIPNGKGKEVPSAEGALKKFIEYHLQPLLERNAPINIIGVLEGGNQRRRALYSEYKSKEAQDADDEVATEQRNKAFLLVQKLLLAMGSVLVYTPTVEADDTIALLCERLKGGKVVYTVDQDLIQLYSPDVSVVVSGQFCTEFEGIDLDSNPTKLITLYKSIIGDKSDTYPGVRGVGPVAWKALVATYGYDGLAELCECLETGDFSPITESLKVSPDKVLQKLYDCRDEWACSYKLAKLHPEWCEMSFGEKVIRPQWSKRVPTMERLEGLLVPLGLGAMIPGLKKWMVTKRGVDAPMLSKINVNALLQAMRKSPVIPFDYESFDSLKHPAYQQAKSGYVDVLNQKITGCSFAFGENLQHCLYFSVNHRDTQNVPASVVLDMLKALDQDHMPPLVAQNAPFEMTLTKTNFDYDFQTEVLDTRVMMSHVNENLPDNLKHMSHGLLNFKQATYEETVPTDGDMRDVSLGEVLDYGCDDSICTGHLFVLQKLIQECELTWDFYEDYEPAFDRIMVPSFIKGIPVDLKLLKSFENEDIDNRIAYTKELRELLAENCSEYNLDGFNTLWQELEPYLRERFVEQETKREEKQKQKNADNGVEPEQTNELADLLDYIAARSDAKPVIQGSKRKAKKDLNVGELLTEARQQTYEACRYTPLSLPVHNWAKARPYSIVARFLGLPALLSIKNEWIVAYSQGLKEQAASQNVTFTSLQAEFLEKLDGAASGGPAGSLPEWAEFCIEVMKSDQSMWVGDELNIDSPKQMAELFYGKMGLPILMRNIDKTDSNRRTMWDLEQAPSTNVNAIETWVAEINDESDWRQRVLELVLKLRAISTRFKLYYNPYPLFQSPVDDKIHPGLRNVGTKTRRPSGSSPNVLQVSRKDEGKIRKVFLPQPNPVEPEVIVSIDFVQQELVIMAGESDDKNLRSCYQGNSRRDVHTFTATGILNIMRSRRGERPITYEDCVAALKLGDKEATKVRKKPAKITNFLMAYGGSAGGLSRKAVVPREMAEQFLEAFYDTYPGVGTYQEARTEQARRYGFVTTCFGTRKHCDGIFDKNKAIRASWERQAGNHPIQGGAADVLKVAMRNVIRNKVLEITGATIYAPVYDELVASVPASKVHLYADLMADCMEMELPGLAIGLETSVSIGKNWGDQIEIGTRPSAEIVAETLAKIFASEEEEETA